MRKTKIVVSILMLCLILGVMEFCGGLWHTTLFTKDMDIHKLILEEDIPLSVSIQGGSFLPTNDTFRRRVLQEISKASEPQWRDNTANRGEVRLRFQGYKDIYYNLQSHTFWFEGSDKLYQVQNTILWSRYMMRMIEGKPTFAGFETTTILTKSLENMHEDTVRLYYDGDLHMAINDTDILLEEAIDESQLISRDKDHLPFRYHLTLLDQEGTFLLYHGTSNMKENLAIQVYQYRDNVLRKIWDSLDVAFFFNNFELDSDQLDLGIAPYIQSKKVKLSNQASERIRKHFDELTKTMKIDEKYYGNIGGNLLHAYRGIRVTEYNQEEGSRLILYISLYSVGAITPPYTEEAMMIFRFRGGELTYEHTLFKHDIRDAEQESLWQEYYLNEMEDYE